MRTAAVVALTVCLFAGCRSLVPDQRITAIKPQPTHQAVTGAPTTSDQPQDSIALVSHEEREEASAPVEAEADHGTIRSAVAPIAAYEKDSNQPATFSLESLQQLALSHHPSLASASARVQSAEGTWEQAGLIPNPVIGYHGTEIGNQGTSGQQGAFINQRWITGGKRQLEREIANRQVDQAYVDLDAERIRLLNDVRIRFYYTLIAERRVELTEQLARIGDESVSATEQLLDARRVSENDLLQAQIAAESAQLLHDDAQNQQQESWQRLSAAVGVPHLQGASLQGELSDQAPSLDWQQCLSHLLAQSPELAVADLEVERAELALERACRGRIPDVDVGVSLRHHNVTADNVVNVQIGMPLPIFDTQQGNIRRAHGELIAAQQSAHQIELDLQDRLAVVFRKHETARQRVNRYSDRILPQARKSLDLVTNGYRQEQVSYLAVLTAQQTYTRANLEYLDALNLLHEAAAAIEGYLLQGSLSNRARR